MVLLLFGVSIGFAQQNIAVSGVVTDASIGDPLIGASVQIKGSKLGTVTDVHGKYDIKTNVGSTLVFSYLGMLKKEVVVTNSVMDIELQPDAKTLNEVVAIGYGTMRKSDLTGSVSNLSGNKLTESIVTNVDKILQGRVAGVQVQANSGAPGAVNSIRIRGTTSLNNSNEPLYIIDGIPVSGAATSTMGFDWSGGSNGQNQANPLANISPNDIVSMDILKDASATAIYGAAGANGVVIITTKRGSKGSNKYKSY